MNNKSVVLPIAWMYRQFSCLFLYIHFFLLFNEIKPFLPNTDELKIHSAEQGVLQHTPSPASIVDNHFSYPLAS